MKKIISDRLIFLSKKVDLYSSGARTNLFSENMKKKVQDVMVSKYKNDYEEGPSLYANRRMPKLKSRE